jgi:protein-L-isoaspartate(D-aspartate) O-methyltransferase
MKEQRDKMMADLRRNKIDEPVLVAMREVRREVYIPREFRDGADPYGDHPCAIGHGQTISQPFIVAYMTQRLDVSPGMRVLEVGTGSGYQAAILAELGADVYTMETVPALARHARAVLATEGYRRVHVWAGDGYAGWPSAAPFDAILVACAPKTIPPALVEQLADGGRMIVPVGEQSQKLVILEKHGDTLTQTDDLPVRFVPMVSRM